MLPRLLSIQMILPALVALSLTGTAHALTFPGGPRNAPTKGEAHVTVTHNGREIKALAGPMNNKPGVYRPPLSTEVKRGDLGTLVVRTPTEGFDGPSDSLLVEVKGMSGNTVLATMTERVPAGGQATFDLQAPGAQDFNAQGNRPQMIAKFALSVTPIRRPARGNYQGAISVK